MSRKIINIEGVVMKQKVRMLIDTGSTLSFVDSKVVENCKLQKVSCEAISIKLADGRTVVRNFYVPKVKWRVQ